VDDRQALAIVTALANGANPVTGEIFPADSPYQAPDVIRALFAAQRALESRAPTSRGAHAQEMPGPQSSGQKTSEQNTPTAQSRAQSQSQSQSRSNAGKPWSGEEDKQLLAAFDADKPLADIARAHGRTVGGVRARLEKHGRLEPSSATRWPAGAKSATSNGSHAER